MLSACRAERGDLVAIYHRVTGSPYQNAHARAPIFSSGDEALRTGVWYNGTMKARRGYRFKMKPTPGTERVFVVMAGHARFVWNKALRLNLDRLARGIPILWCNDLCGLLHLWKQSEEYGFLAEANAQVLQQKCKDLCRAFSAAFDPTQPGKRLPRFKKHGVDDSFRFPQGVRIENRRVYLPKVGWVGYFQSRNVAGTIKSATVSREADGWYVSIQTEITLAEPAPHPGPSMGVDRGVAVVAAASAGELVAASNAGKRLADRMRQMERLLARQRKVRRIGRRRSGGSRACTRASRADVPTSCTSCPRGGARATLSSCWRTCGSAI